MLNTGTRLGAYEITGPIGTGGMGEVYRARDSRLGRDVAIKILPEAFAHDADRLARFQREAKLLASLNHSNIASIYGLEENGKTNALVMELAPGPTLADRIRQAPIPPDEAIPIARQIADALEYAHERGIVHRDLKPANIKIAPDDTVKILDFGLAKAVQGEPNAADIANSPTISQLATQSGILLGTAAYMSPEQAKGKPVDRRADIWAFGCVLYEMLTGKKAFDGETTSDVLAAIMRAEPDWKLLPSAAPMRIRVLLQRCLQKDPKQRLRDIGDARISLDEVLSGAREAAVGAAVTSKSWLSWAASGAAVVLLATTCVLAFLYLHRPTASAPVMRFQIPITDGSVPNDSGALSPDGKKLAFLLTETNGVSRIWIRSLDSLDARPLDGTEGATRTLFWSPDSRYLAFSTGSKLVKIDASGGPPQTLCDTPGPLGGSWNRNDEIVFGTDDGIGRVSAAGGSPTQITSSETAALPEFLPDGRHFLYLTPVGIGAAGPGVYVGTVDSKSSQPPVKKLLSDASPAVYVPRQGAGTAGYLLFVRGGAVAPGATGTLMAQPFDPRRLEFTGDAVPIADGVPNTGFTASPTGTLIYLASGHAVVIGGSGVRGVIQGRLGWLDREGKVVGTFGDPGQYRTLALSPDAKHLAFERVDPEKPSTVNLWVFEFARGVTSRFTFDSGWDSTPVWSPDGSRIVFGSQRSAAGSEAGSFFDLYQKASNLAGDDQLIFTSKEHKLPSSWSPDGRILLYYNPVPPVRLWALPVGSGPHRKSIEIGEKQFNEALGRLSPNGRWMSYTSDESGRSEIYVRPFDEATALGSPASSVAPGGKWMVSNGGGNTALWSRDGKELFYIALDGTAMSVDVNINGVFQAGVPKPMFKVPPGVLFWDVSPDDKRFVMAIPSAESTTPKFNVVLNWQSALRR